MDVNKIYEVAALVVLLGVFCQEKFLYFGGTWSSTTFWSNFIVKIFSITK